ncbi:unnamed protein product, partial [Meganyctiphanes norvegica]
TNHLRRHIGEKNQCSHCAKISKNSNLIRHQRTDSGKTYQCSQCVKSFSNKSNHTHYLEAHTEDKSHQSKVETPILYQNNASKFVLKEENMEYVSCDTGEVSVKNNFIETKLEVLEEALGDKVSNIVDLMRQEFEVKE